MSVSPVLPRFAALLSALLWFAAVPAVAQPGGAVDGPAEAVAPSPGGGGGDPGDPGALGAEAVVPGETTLGAETGAEDSAGEGEGVDFAELLGYGGIVGHAIIALSVLAGALAALFFFELRHRRLVPPVLYEAVYEKLGAADAEGAIHRCRGEDSLLAHVLASGIAALRDGRAEARAVMADAADSWMAASTRRVEYLNLITTVSPMLGLLGTVMGMVKTFAALSKATGPVDPVALSAGIFQALVTTMMGLAVAIPTLLVYVVLRNRADDIQTSALTAGEELVAAWPGAGVGRAAGDAGEVAAGGVGGAGGVAGGGGGGG